MEFSDPPSSPGNIFSFRSIVGIDIGSETYSFCALKPDKRKARQANRMRQCGSWI